MQKLNYPGLLSLHTEGSFITDMHTQEQHLEIIIAISGNAKQGQNPFYLERPHGSGGKHRLAKADTETFILDTGLY